MKPIKGYDQERVHHNLAKLKKAGEEFEVIINPDKILEYKNKKLSDPKEVLLSDKVFYDAKKGLEAGHEHMKTVFGTDDISKVAKLILDEGEIQFTQDYREQKRKEKHNKIMDLIVRNAVDPTTGFPHPRVRIEAAFLEAKVHIDEYKEAEDQVNGIVSKLKPILPIKLEIKEIQVRMPGSFSGKAHGIIERFGKRLNEEWMNDGSWACTVELPAGLQNEFFDALNKLTHGDVETKILREKQA